MADIFLNVGSNRLTVNPYRITGNMSETLNGKLDEAIMKTLFKELPASPGESREVYDARYKALQETKKAAAKAKKESAKEETTKKSSKKVAADDSEKEETKVEGESLLEFVRKELNLTRYEDQMTYLFDCVKAIADTFDNQGHKADTKALKDCPLVEVNNFVFRICKYARIPIGLEEIVIDYDDFS